MIILMRHARTGGGTGSCIGGTHVPLSDEGRQQAEKLTEWMDAIPFARLYSSPAQRAMETIAPFAEAHHCPVEMIPGLDEINMGTWDGLTFADIRTRFPDEYAERGSRFGEFRPPGGESFNDVADRAMNVLDILAAGPRPVLAVTHAGVIRSVLCRLTGHPMDDLFHFMPDHVQCTLIRPAPAGLGLVTTGIPPEELSTYL